MSISSKKEYTFSFPELSGGINIHEAEFALSPRESPKMVNLLWQDGALNCRDGQQWLCETEAGTGYAMYKRLWQDCLLFHAGAKLWSYEIETNTLTQIRTGVPQNRGTFFEYDDYLFYKNKGGFYRIDSAMTVTAVDDPDTAYVPVTVMNASPATGSGDLYQPENRLSPRKTVSYNADGTSCAYHLPVNAASVVEVTLNGTAVTGWTYIGGVVSFPTAPPAGQNNVKITYSKSNSPAKANIMDCRYAEVYGGTGSLTIVLAGSETQPNAYFWNGNDNISMNPSYWPMENYQLAGDTWDAVTGFGKQQNYLAVFKEHSVGKTVMSTEEIDGRMYIDLPYQAVNAVIGCDIPWSIQLIENNLVWCSSESGVHMLLDTTEVNENNIVCISAKVNGSAQRQGLLHAMKKADSVCSMNDSKKYYICADSQVWLWDYELTPYTNPSWFYCTEIAAVDFARKDDTIWHLNPAGQLTEFVRSFSDYGEAIEKFFRFPVQIFGGYDRLKNINSVIIATRSDTNTNIRLRYVTDYEKRYDLTDLTGYSNHLVPRDLSFRCLYGRTFSYVFRRKPKCLHVRHFAMELSNAVVGCDMSIISAQVFFNYQGRQR